MGRGEGDEDGKAGGYGERIIRCPRLGGEVPFSYCEREGGEVPCRLVVRCWAVAFPVEDYLRARLTPALWERFSSAPPKDRITTLVEVIDAAKRRRQEREAGDP